MTDWLNDVQDGRTVNAGARWREARACRRAAWRPCAKSGHGASPRPRGRNCPVKRVLRDDLIVELVRRRSVDPKQIRAIRGMERGDLSRAIPDLSAAIDRRLKKPDSECPRIVRTDNNSQLNLLGQFLTSALGSICRAAEVAPSIVGTASDVRELVAFLLAGKSGEKPLLAHGWRAEVVGQVLEDLLRGKLAIRIRDPKSDQPLAFEPAHPQAK